MTQDSLTCSCGHWNPLHCILLPQLPEHRSEHKDAAVRKISRENRRAAVKMRSVLPSLAQMAQTRLRWHQCLPPLGCEQVDAFIVTSMLVSG